MGWDGIHGSNPEDGKIKIYFLRPLIYLLVLKKPHFKVSFRSTNVLGQPWQYQNNTIESKSIMFFYETHDSETNLG